MKDIHILKKHLEKKLYEISPLKNINGWLSSLSFSINTQQNILEVMFPHVFFQTWFAEHMQTFFEKALFLIWQDELSAPLQIHYKKTKKTIKEAPLFYQDLPVQHANFFKDFIYNAKNEFPLALAKEISQKPFSAIYNPFVIYGKTSTGKTHILQCMKNAMEAYCAQSHVYDHTVLSMPSDSFYSYLQHKGVLEVVASHQIFIIDKLQNISPLQSVQEIFLQFIELCLEQKKQLIFACSTYPENEKQFIPSVCSRLHSGLVVELKNSDIDVRMRYAVMHCKMQGIKLPKEHILLIAQRCTNISQLQGVILKIFAFQKQYTHKLQTSDIEKVLLFSGEEGKNITPQNIISSIASYFEMSEEHILSSRRSPDIVRARQLSMYLCRDILGLSYPAIGKFFNGKDHSTVMYAIKNIKKLTDTNKNMQHMVTELKKKCLSL